MRKLILSLVAIAAIAGITYTQILPGITVIGTAKNVQGTIEVMHADADGWITLQAGAALLDDDEIRLYKGSSFDAVSAYGMPTVTIRHGALGYWNSETGTLNPPNPDWARCRGCFYTSYY